MKEEHGDRQRIGWCDSVDGTRTIQQRGRIGGVRVVVRERKRENAKSIKSGTETKTKERRNKHSID